MASIAVVEIILQKIFAEVVYMTGRTCGKTLSLCVFRATRSKIGYASWFKEYNIIFFSHSERYAYAYIPEITLGYRRPFKGYISRN